MLILHSKIKSLKMWSFWQNLNIKLNKNSCPIWNQPVISKKIKRDNMLNRQECLGVKEIKIITKIWVTELIWAPAKNLMSTMINMIFINFFDDWKLKEISLKWIVNYAINSIYWYKQVNGILWQINCFYLLNFNYKYL